MNLQPRFQNVLSRLKGALDPSAPSSKNDTRVQAYEASSTQASKGHDENGALWTMSYRITWRRVDTGSASEAVPETGSLDEGGLETVGSLPDSCGLAQAQQWVEALYLRAAPGFDVVRRKGLRVHRIRLEDEGRHILQVLEFEEASPPRAQWMVVVPPDQVEGLRMTAQDMVTAARGMAVAEPSIARMMMETAFRLRDQATVSQIHPLVAP